MNSVAATACHVTVVAAAIDTADFTSYTPNQRAWKSYDDTNNSCTT